MTITQEGDYLMVHNLLYKTSHLHEEHSENLEIWNCYPSFCEVAYHEAYESLNPLKKE